jgi:imidazolonepropionase-like amidohydrolase
MKCVTSSFRKNLIAVPVTGLLLFPLNVMAQPLFISDATVHTMGSHGVLQETDLLIREGHIRAIGPGLTVPADASVIEAGGRPVTPGFFAGISSLGLQEIGLEAATVDSGLDTEALRPEFDVTTAFNPNASAIPVTRIEGYTWTMLAANRAGSIIGGLGRAVSLDGGYSSFLSDKVLFIDVGADASELSGGSRAAQWMLLNRAMSESRSEVSWSPEPLLTTAGRRVMKEFAGSGTVLFNADRASDILQVLEFAENQQINAVITGGAEAWMVADSLAEAGVPVLLNPLLNLPSNFDQLGARLDNAAILNAAGVTVSFHNGETNNARKLRQAAGNAVANGLPYEAALAGLTVNPARIFDLADDRGVLEENSRADLVIWSGDPLEVTSVADQVIINGKAIPMVSRQTLLRDRYLPVNPELPRAYIKP